MNDALGPGGLIRFLPCPADEVAAATGKEGPLFALRPGEEDTGAASADASDSGNECGSGASDCDGSSSDSSGNGSGDRIAPDYGLTGVHDTHSLSDVAYGLVSAVHDATHVQPSFNSLELRINLGTQLFYQLDGLEQRSGVAPRCLLRASRRDARRLRSVYSNAVPAATVPRVADWLTGARGFTAGATDTDLVLHVINQELNVHYSITLRVEGTAARLGKLESSSTKCHFVVLLSGRALDLRLRLMGQHEDLQDPTARAVAQHVVAEIGRVGLDAFLAAPSRHLPSRHMYCDSVRRRDRTKYAGSVQAGDGSVHPLEVFTQRVQEVVEVFDRRAGVGLRSSEIYEIGGSLPGLEAELQFLLTDVQQSSAAQAAPDRLVSAATEAEVGVTAEAAEGKAAEVQAENQAEGSSQVPGAGGGGGRCGGGGGGDEPLASTHGEGFSADRVESLLSALKDFALQLNDHLEAGH